MLKKVKKIAIRFQIRSGKKYKSDLPEKALDNKKIKGIISVSGRNFDQKLKAFVGARDFRDGVLGFITDLREHNLAPTVVKKMRENIQHD